MNNMNEQNDIPITLLEELREYTGDFILFYEDLNGDSSFLPCVEKSTSLAGLMLHAKKMSEAFENKIKDSLSNFFG